MNELMQGYYFPFFRPNLSLILIRLYKSLILFRSNIEQIVQSRVFYVDPDEKEMNDKVLIPMIKQANLDKNTYGSIAIINMAATWAPNFAIEKALKQKQQEFPDTIYVRDKDKVLVDKWELKDDSYHVVLFDKTGKVLYSKSGELSKSESEKFINLIKEHSQD
ncbi:YtfJ family protein [Deltaproteobacteria bacterium TL4]